MVMMTLTAPTTNNFDCIDNLMVLMNLITLMNMHTQWKWRVQLHLSHPSIFKKGLLHLFFFLGYFSLPKKISLIKVIGLMRVPKCTHGLKFLTGTLESLEPIVTPWTAKSGSTPKMCFVYALLISDKYLLKSRSTSL